MSDRAPLRVAFVIGELAPGGAEVMLWRIASGLDPARFAPVVIALSARTDPHIEKLFRSSGVDYRLLGMRSPADVLALFRLARLLHTFAPDLVQGWMYYGNLAATLSVALTLRATPVLWNIRGTLIDGDKRLSHLAIRAGAKLSSTPARIINNSLVSAVEHEQRLGYAKASRVILPNGFDTGTFRPSGEARSSVRAALGLAPDALLVGLINRYHPMKDHASFFAAVRRLGLDRPDVHFLLAGDRIERSNRDLVQLVPDGPAGERVHLLGPREDIPRLTAALDLAVMCSASGEGFPNVVGEAMSCGVPCVVTDVGDAADIVGDTGVVVPPRDPGALAAALAGLIDMPRAAREALGARARVRVMERYSIEAIVRQYEDLYTEVSSRRARVRTA